MYLRRKTFRRYIGDKGAVKALALLYFVKNRIKSSVITRFSYNKLHLLTGLHITTLRKYIKKLREMGLVVSCGNHNCNLLFKGDYSKDKRKNVNLDVLIYDSVKDVAKSLYAMFVVEIQRRKDFVKQVILISTNPDKYTPLCDIKAALKYRNRFGYGNVYHETGISYNNLAERLGVFTQKAVSIIKFAVSHHFVHKQTRKLWEQCDDAFIRAKLGIDYVCAKVVDKIDNFGKNIKMVFGLRVKANTYTIAERVRCVCSPITPPLV